VVEQLFVAPGHELRGIGDRLLAYAEGYAIAERARFALCGTATCSAGLAPRQGVNKLLWDETQGHLQGIFAMIARVSSGLLVFGSALDPLALDSRLRGGVDLRQLCACVL
jgi:hypothetical protein